MMTVKSLLLILLLVLVSCSETGKLFKQSYNDSHSVISNCNTLIATTERVITAAGVKDSQSHRLPDYPYLRVNRFLSSFRHEVDDHQVEFWLIQLQQLAEQGWKVELQNLSVKDRKHLKKMARAIHPESTVMHNLQRCAVILRDQITDDFDTIRKQAWVASNYQTWKRIAGFYPLSAIPFRFAIRLWHDQTLQTFKQALQQLPVKGQLLRYGPGLVTPRLNQDQVARIIHQASDNELNIPLPDAAQQQKLFEHFAPVFEIDTETDEDKLGTVVLDQSESATIDISRPIVYHHLSHTRIGSKILLQLNYNIWFPARPKQSIFDMLGGHLDGIIWRLTLSEDGNPLIFDSIHACGCYHLFFPSQQSAMLANNFLFNEPAFSPQAPIKFKHDKRLLIRIAANNHYLQRVYLTPNPQIQRIYQWADYDTLRSLPLANKLYKSLFSEEGMITGSERSERYLFWPMGIPNPGAMRQWGHHATAFVGHRHFDDARLLENSFHISPVNQ